MRSRYLGLALVLAAAGALVVAKIALRPPEAASAAKVAAAPDRARPAAAVPQVVLVADSREATSDCGCGEIIRRVRAAKGRGVAVEEVSPDDGESLRRLGVTVAPTVVMLGADGKVVSRLEGEAPQVVAALDAALVRLEGAVR